MMTVEEQDQRIREEVRRASGGLKGAIHGKCVECSYDPEAPGSAVEQIDACNVNTCSLYPHRRRTDDGTNSLQVALPTRHKVAKESWQRNDNLRHALMTKGGLKDCIKANCIECIYDKKADAPLSSGTWTQQVTECRSNKTDVRMCPLWPVRPTSTKRHTPQTTGAVA